MENPQQHALLYWEGGNWENNSFPAEISLLNHSRVHLFPPFFSHSYAISPDNNAAHLEDQKAVVRLGGPEIDMDLVLAGRAQELHAVISRYGTKVEMKKFHN